MGRGFGAFLPVRKALGLTLSVVTAISLSHVAPASAKFVAVDSPAISKSKAEKNVNKKAASPQGLTQEQLDRMTPAQRATYWRAFVRYATAIEAAHRGEETARKSAKLQNSLPLDLILPQANADAEFGRDCLYRGYQSRVRYEDRQCVGPWELPKKDPYRAKEQAHHALGTCGRNEDPCNPAPYLLTVGDNRRICVPTDSNVSACQVEFDRLRSTPEAVNEGVATLRQKVAGNDPKIMNEVLKESYHIFGKHGIPPKGIPRAYQASLNAATQQLIDSEKPAVDPQRILEGGQVAEQTAEEPPQGAAPKVTVRNVPPEATVPAVAPAAAPAVAIAQAPVARITVAPAAAAPAPAPRKTTPSASPKTKHPLLGDELSCIKNAVDSDPTLNISSGGASPSYIALLAIVSQQYQGYSKPTEKDLYETVDSNGQKKEVSGLTLLRQKIIRNIQNYGFCEASAEDKRLEQNADQIRNWIKGTTRDGRALEKVKNNYIDEVYDDASKGGRVFKDIFGIGEGLWGAGDLGYFFKPDPNLETGDSFKTRALKQERWLAKDMEKKGTGFWKACFPDMVDRIHADGNFRYATANSTIGHRPPRHADDVEKDNSAMCKRMADACGMEDDFCYPPKRPGAGQAPSEAQPRQQGTSAQ